MRRALSQALRALCTALLLPCGLLPAAAQVTEGRLPTGAAYRFELPPAWNGSVLLYSRGYGSAGPVQAAPEKLRAALLSRGYALVAASYANPGWALAEAVPDQLAALDTFALRHGEPRRTIAWGSSMGALVTLALVERHPARFQGALAMCGSLSGTLGMMNTALDAAWSFATLQQPGLPLRLNAPGDAGKAQRQQWIDALAAARATPLGRARLTLAAVLGQVPAWADARQPRPAADDTAAQIDALAAAFAPAVLLPRDDQEARAGGNFSWNEGVDHADLLRRSGREALVRAAYAQAGAALDADLARLASAPRVSADAAAAGYMLRHYVPSGRATRPLLLLQTTADPLTLPELSADYLRNAQAAGHGAQVRAAWVDKLHHCNFEPAEVLAALQALEQRIDGQPWRTDAASLNRAAAEAGQAAPAFVDTAPAPLLRPCHQRADAAPGAPGTTAAQGGQATDPFCPGLPPGARAIAARPPVFPQPASPAWVPPDTPLGSGRHPAVMEALPQHTVYRPADLAAAPRLPVLAWANGACLNVGTRFRWFLSEIASHGFLVIAIGPPGPPDSATAVEIGSGLRGRPAPDSPAARTGAPGAAESSPAQLTQAIDWALAEHARPGSPLQGRIATDRIAVMGQSCGGLQALALADDPRVRSFGIWNSGVLDDPALAGRIAGAPLDKAWLARLRVPVLYITGEPSDVAFPNTDDDFARITGVPVVRAWRVATAHAGTYREPGGGAFAPVAVDWLRWQLLGDSVAAARFSGPDCGLCREPGWLVRRKHMP